MKRFPRVLRKIKDSRRLSYADLARAIECNRSSITQYMAGRKLPSKQRLGLIINRLALNNSESAEMYNAIKEDLFDSRYG